MRGKLICKNWLAELGFDPSSKSSPKHTARHQLTTVSLDRLTARAAPDKSNAAGRQERERIDLIREAVVEAMANLPSKQREFIERYYYLGESYTDMSRETGRARWVFESLHMRALKSLRKRLEPFVVRRYGIDVARRRPCAVCASEKRVEIDQFLRTRDPRATWKSILRQVRTIFGLRIKWPQTLITHEKYH